MPMFGTVATVNLSCVGWLLHSEPGEPTHECSDTTWSKRYDWRKQLMIAPALWWRRCAVAHLRAVTPVVMTLSTRCQHPLRLYIIRTTIISAVAVCHPASQRAAAYCSRVRLSPW